MDVGIRELRNDTARAVELTGAALSRELASRSADPALRTDPDELAGQTLADL